MGGFVDPFIPAPAWPQDVVFNGTSWSRSASSLADSSGTYLAAAGEQDTEFHLQNSTALLPVELHEQFLQAQLQDDVTQGLNFEMDRALMGGTLGSVMSTPCAISLADSALVVCSSNDSSGSEQSGLPQFLMGEQPVPAPATWTSTFTQISSLVGEETSQSFDFGVVSNDDLLHEGCAADGKKYPQLRNVPSGALQLQVGDQKHKPRNFWLNNNLFLYDLLIFILYACRMMVTSTLERCSLSLLVPGSK